MTDYRTFKVKGRQTGSPCSFVRFDLEGYVKYKDKVNNVIYCVNCSPFNEYQIYCSEPLYLEIDFDETRDYNSRHEFVSTDIVRKVSSGEVVSRSSNNLTSIDQNQASGLAIQMLNRAIDSDTRNKYTASMEVDPKTGNIFYHLSGQRK